MSFKIGGVGTEFRADRDKKYREFVIDKLTAFNEGKTVSLCKGQTIERQRPLLFCCQGPRLLVNRPELVQMIEKLKSTEFEFGVYVRIQLFGLATYLGPQDNLSLKKVCYVLAGVAVENFQPCESQAAKDFVTLHRKAIAKAAYDLHAQFRSHISAISEDFDQRLAHAFNLPPESTTNSPFKTTKVAHPTSRTDISNK